MLFVDSVDEEEENQEDRLGEKSRWWNADSKLIMIRMIMMRKRKVLLRWCCCGRAAV